MVIVLFYGNQKRVKLAFQHSGLRVLLKRGILRCFNGSYPQPVRKNNA